MGCSVRSPDPLRSRPIPSDLARSGLERNRLDLCIPGHIRRTKTFFSRLRFNKPNLHVFKSETYGILRDVYGLLFQSNEAFKRLTKSHSYLIIKRSEFIPTVNFGISVLFLVTRWERREAWDT